MAVAFLQGILIGIAAVLPGISGGLLCVVFHIYEPVTEVLGDFRKFKKNARVLLPVLFGIPAGFFVAAYFLNHLFEAFPEQSLAIFCGLTAGMLPGLWLELRRDAPTGKAYLLPFCIAFATFLIILLLPQYLSTIATLDTHSDISGADMSQSQFSVGWHFHDDSESEGERLPQDSSGLADEGLPQDDSGLADEGLPQDDSGLATKTRLGPLSALICGFFVAVSFLAPGLSFSAVLLPLGLYEPFLYTLSHPSLLPLSFASAGFAVAFLLLGKVVHYLLQTRRTTFSSCILGLLCASLLCTLPGLTFHFTIGIIASLLLDTVQKQ